MNILIVSNNYLQRSIISSKRWRCFSNYLSRENHNIWVICGDYEDYKGELFSIQELEKNNLHIFKIGEMELFFKYLLAAIRCIRGKTPSPEMTGTYKIVPKYMYLQKMKKINYLFQYLKTAVSNSLYTQFCLSKFRKSKLIHKLGNIKYDLIIASCGPLDSLIIGNVIRKKHPEAIYINEFRDMLHARKYMNMAMNDYFIRYEKKHVLSADATLVVSEGQKEMLCDVINPTQKKKDCIHVLYHGYDSSGEDAIVSVGEQDNLSFQISYTGTIDPNDEDPEMLFCALDELIQENKLNKDKIRINFAGIGCEYFTSIAQKYGLSSSLQNYGFIDKRIAMQIQKQSDLLLLLCNNGQYEKGMLSGKFSEYLYSGKPIIALTTGKLANAEITELISVLRVGIACEYINQRNDLSKLKEYILLQYERKIKGIPLLYKPDISAVEQFNYKFLTKKLISIFEKYSYCKK